MLRNDTLGSVYSCFNFQEAVGSTSWRIRRLLGAVGRDRPRGPRVARAGTCPRGDFFTQERTRGGLGRAGQWPQTRRPWVALGKRSAVERIKGNQAGPGFRIFCFSALQPGASIGQTARVGGLVILPLAFWFCTLGLPRDTTGPCGCAPSPPLSLSADSPYRSSHPPTLKC